MSHIMSVNAAELIFMCHKRLCFQASKETREVMEMIRDEVLDVCPEFKEVLVPLCEYRGGVCTEMFPCGRANKPKTKVEINPDKESVEYIRQKLRENDGYCPCSTEKIPDTKCMCKEFRDMDEGQCRCGLYIKTKVK